MLISQMLFNRDWDEVHFNLKSKCIQILEQINERA